MLNGITNNKNQERALRRSRRYARKNGRVRFFRNGSATALVA